MLGLSGLVSPHGVDVSAAAIKFDIPVMIAVAVACWPIFITGNMIARWEGAVFLLYYLAYTTYLILQATSHPLQQNFGQAMLLFVIPLTVLTLAVSWWRSTAMRIRTIPRLGELETSRFTITHAQARISCSNVPGCNSRCDRIGLIF